MMISKTKHNNESDEEEYQTDEQSEQYKLTDDNAYSEYIEDDENKSDRFKFVAAFCLWIRGRVIHFFKIIIINMPMYGFTSSYPLSILFSQFFPSFETFFKIIQVTLFSRKRRSASFVSCILVSIDLFYYCPPVIFNIGKIEK
jgi:hypothetical protein